MFNLAPSETLVLVQELPCFDNTIKLKLLLASYLDLCVHDLISGLFFHATKVEIYQCKLFYYL
jgi:hypothetical protein